MWVYTIIQILVCVSLTRALCQHLTQRELYVADIRTLQTARRAGVCVMWCECSKDTLKIYRIYLYQSDTV